jgi:hypothetical protein
MLLKSSTYELSAVVLATIMVLTSTLGPLLPVSVGADIVGRSRISEYREEGRVALKS